MENVFTVQEIFSDKIFRVPNYQRGYSWEERQCRELIEDIDELPMGKKHYTGTLIFHLDEKMESITDEGGAILKKFNIVDGQQRLTSLVILLHCIAEYFKVLGNHESLYWGIRKKYVMLKDIERQDRPRLILNEHCHNYYLKNIISESPEIIGWDIQSHKRLSEAKKFFHEYLIEKSSAENDFKTYLKNLMTKITNALEFTMYKVKEETDVGVIFEVMNNRGKPLSEMEKVKNYLIYLAKRLEPKAAEELDEEINRVWASILEDLMEASESSSEIDEDQLLRSSWLMAYDPHPKYWERYKSVKEKFNLKEFADQHDLLLSKMEAYIKLLENSCRAYCDVMAPKRQEAFKEYADNPDIRRRLIQRADKLLRIGNISPFLPILMAARLKYPHDYELYERVLDIIEKYAFRIFRLQEKRSNTGQAALLRRGFELYCAEITPDLMLRKIKSKLLEYSPDSDYRAVFVLGRKNWYEFSGLKYLLYEYEEHLAKGKSVQLPWENVQKKDKKDTIEHILPQYPSRDYWKERWTQEQIQKYLHDIGNLTLTFDNSAYGNKAFPDKKGKPGTNGYWNSNMFQERMLTKWDDWTEKELLERRKEIVEWALERWEVEPEGVEEPEEEVFIEDGPESEEIAEDEDDFLIDKEWDSSEIVDYLRSLEESNARLTLCYFKALASSDKPLSFRELLSKLGELKGKNLSGRVMAGVWSGIYKSTKKLQKERLDLLKDAEDQYSLRSNYKEIVRGYFNL